MPKPKVTPFDKYFGERIREARLEIKMSQQDLGGLLGVSFQQVQKYERGQNRMSASRFDLLTTALRRPLSFFFQSESDVRSTADPIMSQFISSKRGLEMAKKFPRLRTSGQQLVLQVVDELIEKERV